MKSDLKFVKSYTVMVVQRAVHMKAEVVPKWTSNMHLNRNMELFLILLTQPHNLWIRTWSSSIHAEWGPELYKILKIGMLELYRILLHIWHWLWFRKYIGCKICQIVHSGSLCCVVHQANYWRVVPKWASNMWELFLILLHACLWLCFRKKRRSDLKFVKSYTVHRKLTGPKFCSASSKLLKSSAKVSIQHVGIVSDSATCLPLPNCCRWQKI